MLRKAVPHRQPGSQAPSALKSLKGDDDDDASVAFGSRPAIHGSPLQRQFINSGKCDIYIYIYIFFFFLASGIKAGLSIFRPESELKIVRPGWLNCVAFDCAIVGNKRERGREREKEKERKGSCTSPSPLLSSPLPCLSAPIRCLNGKKTQGHNDEFHPDASRCKDKRPKRKVHLS